MISSSDKLVQQSCDSVALFSAASSHDLTVHFRPNNLVKFSTTPARPPRQKPKSSGPTGCFTGGHPQSLLPSAFPPDDLNEASPLGISSKLQRPSLPPDLPQSSEQNDLPLMPAPLSFVPSLPRAIPPRPHPKRFTRHARQVLLEIGGAIEKEGFLPEDCIFFTATVPGSTPQVMEYISRYSRYIVNLLKQYLRYKYGINLTLNVWEWQRRGALHFHLLFIWPSGKKVSAVQIGDELREKWLDYLGNIEQHSGVDMFSRATGGSWHRKSKSVQQNCCKTIQLEAKKGSSPVAYLSKYIGKQGLASRVSGSNSQDLYYPSSWWSASRALRVLADAHSASFTIRIPSNMAVNTLLEISDLFSLEGSLVLDAFSPSFAQDYTYRNIYIPSEHYHETIEVMRMTLEALSEDISQSCTDSSFGKFPFLHSLMEAKNHKAMTDFTFNWLSFHNRVHAAQVLFGNSPFLDPAAPFLETKAKEYILQHDYPDLHRKLYPHLYQEKKENKYAFC